MSVRIIKKGLLDTIQDTGRYGYQHVGINPNGAMDGIAAAIANMLVGNNFNEPVIEMHFPAASFLFESEALIALSGAHFGATINKEPVIINSAIRVSKNSFLEFSKHINGARCYLAVQGGWQSEKWLGSYSTNLKINAGGHEGRALKKDDFLNFKQEQNFSFLQRIKKAVEVNIAVDVSSFYHLNAIRCIRGEGYKQLNDTSKKIFSSSSFTITPQSDRMGFRLHGEPLMLTTKQELLSSAVTGGAIQLLPSGQMIVLMADHQTTGGYTIVAHIASADMPSLAQKNTNEKINFELIEHDEAEIFFIEQQQQLIFLKEKIAAMQLQ